MAAGLQDQLVEMERAHQNNLNVIEEIEQENADIKEAAVRIRKESEAKERTIKELNERIALTLEQQSKQLAPLRN